MSTLRHSFQSSTYHFTASSTTLWLSAFMMRSASSQNAAASESLSPLQAEFPWKPLPHLLLTSCPENPVCHVVALSFYTRQWGLCRWTLPSRRRTSMLRPLTFLFLKTIYSTKQQTVFFPLLREIPKKTQHFTPARSLPTSTCRVMELSKYRFRSSLWLREDGIGFSSPLQPSSLAISVTTIQI